MAAVAYNGDLCTEILLRLPVKSVLNLKTVSKQWLSIVCSPRFRQAHASRHRAATGIFLGPNCRKTGSVELHPVISQSMLRFSCPPGIRRRRYRRWPRFTCVSSCNGLQLLEYEKGKSGDHAYYVYNPTTKEHKALEIPTHISRAKYRKFSASLAFDPCELPYHYKVVFLGEVKGSINTHQIDVYSSVEGTWKVIVIDNTNNYYLPVFFNEENCHGTFCNGALHWLSGTATSMIYFNVTSECLKKMATPKSWHVHYFGESRGHLHIVQSSSATASLSLLDVFELKRDYSGWFFKYQVDVASITGKSYGNYSFASIFENYDEKEEEGSTTMLILADEEWVEYNFTKKTMQTLCKNKLPCSIFYSYGCFKTHQLIPTLACV